MPCLSQPHLQMVALHKEVLVTESRQLTVACIELRLDMLFQKSHSLPYDRHMAEHHTQY